MERDQPLGGEYDICGFVVLAARGLFAWASRRDGMAKEQTVEKTKDARAVDATKMKLDPAEIRFKVTLSPEEAAYVLGYGLTVTYALLRSGDIPSHKNGRFWRVLREAVDAYIEQREAENSCG